MSSNCLHTLETSKEVRGAEEAQNDGPSMLSLSIIPPEADMPAQSSSCTHGNGVEVISILRKQEKCISLVLLATKMMGAYTLAQPSLSTRRMN